MAGSSTEMELDEFLGHSGRAQSKYLGDWKEKGKVDVWLSKRASIIAIWRHGVPHIVNVEDAKTKEMVDHIWNQRCNCREDESVLKSMFKRDRQTGERVAPPERCPIDRMVEWFYQQVASNQLSWVDEVFKWQCGEGKMAEERVIHAGGLYNAFGSQKLSAEEHKEMKEAGVSPKEAWKENFQAKLNYAFTIVDNSDVKAGPQIAVEAALLGDKVKVVVRKEIESKGKEKGSPKHNPYCIRFKYDEHAKQFNESYDALRIDDDRPLTDEILAAIEADPPDTSGLRMEPKWSEVRENLEEHCLIDGVPWDEFFAGVGDPEEVEKKEAAPETQKEKPKDSPAPKQATDVRRNGSGPLPAAPAPKQEPKVQMVSCETSGCSATMPITATKCPKCGTEYEVEGEEEPAKPEPPKPPTRAELKAAEKNGKKPAPKEAPKAPPKEGDDFLTDDDEMTF